MRKAIEERYSVRTFSTTPLKAEDVAFLQEQLEEINQVSGLNATFLEDGSAAFSSVRTSYGMFKDVRSLVLLKGNPSVPDFLEKAGFYGENLVLDLYDRGIGTCWVGGTFDRTVFSIPENEQFICALLVGYPGKIALKDQVLLARLHKRYKPISERLTSDGDVPADIQNGLEAVRLAPSAVNTQTPHFTYKDGVLTAGVPEEGKFGLVDLGIAKSHFVQEAGGTFAFGNNATWTK